MNRLKSFALLAACFASPVCLEATKQQPLVVGRWYKPPATVAVNKEITILLRIEPSADVAEVFVQLKPQGHVKVVGPSEWKGAVTKGKILDLPFRVRFKGEGGLGASISQKATGNLQESGTYLQATESKGV